MERIGFLLSGEFLAEKADFLKELGLMALFFEIKGRSRQLPGPLDGSKSVLEFSEDVLLHFKH